MAKEDEIRLIAFNIWQEEGCVDGRDCEHWYRAEVIWEQNQKAARSAKSEPKQTASQNAKAGGAGKKSRKR